MCDCIKDLKEKLLRTAKEQFPGESHRVSTPADGVVCFSKNLDFVKATGFTKFTTTYTTLTKTGKIKKHTLENNIVHKFCPFCGEAGRE